MALQNFVDYIGPKISAAWLNAVDALKYTVFADATTKSAARAALTSDAVWPVSQGGTGATSVADALQSLQVGGPTTSAEVDAGITPTNFAYPPGDVRRYGAVLNGVADDTDILQDCADFCFASGVPIQGAEGIAKISSTLTLKCAGDLGMMTISAASSSFTPAVRVGTIAGNPLQLQGCLVLPKVINSTKPPLGDGWAGQQVGVELANLYESYITVPYIYGFGVGLDCGGYNSGFSYNTVQIITLFNNKIGLRVGGKTILGWANENVFIGGRIWIDSSEGYEITDSRYIQLIPQDTTTTGKDWPNGNKFFGQCVEGNQPKYMVECSGVYNQFYGLRYESSGLPYYPTILLTGHLSDVQTCYNQFIGGYRLATGVFTRVGLAPYTMVLDGATSTFAASGVGINLCPESGSDYPAIQVFDPSGGAEWLNATAAATGWTARISADFLKGKAVADSTERIGLYFQTGKVKFTVLAEYADDSAAATGGVEVGQLYRTGSAVKVRVS